MFDTHCLGLNTAERFSYGILHTDAYVHSRCSEDSHLREAGEPRYLPTNTEKSAHGETHEFLATQSTLQREPTLSPTLC